ncbi:MAG: tetratricopeptide repeat protein, partial [Pseudomonadota bacterium]
MTVASRAWGTGPPEYLRTHPLSTSRAAEAKARADALEPRSVVEDSMFYYVQARLRVDMTRHADRAIEYFEAQLRKQAGPESAHRYGLALSYMSGSRLDEAEDELRWLLNYNPGSQLFQLLEAEFMLRQGRLDESLAAYQRLFSAYGHSQVIALGYAKALLHDGDPEKALIATDILREQARLRPTDINTSELLAQAADTAGDEVRSLEAVAENYYLRGGLPQAIEQLERITRRGDLDYYQRARVSARLGELRTERARYLRAQ